MIVQTITSLDLPELLPYRTLRRPLDHSQRGLFVAEGTKVVDRLLDSSLTVRSVLLTDDWFGRLRTRLEKRVPPPEIFVGTKDMLQHIVGFRLHQGLMALAEIPVQPPVEDIVKRGARPALFIALDGLVNSENVGIIVRNARAFGVSAVLVGETSSSPYLRRAVRNSLGAVFTLPILHTPDLATALRQMRTDHNVAVYGAETKQGGVPLDDVDLTPDVCLVVGSEDSGIRKQILKECTLTVEIPMSPGIESLNVANATAVLLYEAQRQRHARA